MVSIYKLNKPVIRNKLASFDYDWTIVNPKNSTFPKNINDWEWYNNNVPNIIKNYYNDGYMIVIFTNQSKKWKYKQIKLVCLALQIPIYAVIASKINYKPNTIMYDSLFENINIDKKNSFYVGDALGRKIDFSNSDKEFANNIGIKYYSPEQIFCCNNNFIIPEIKLSKNPEIIIIVGYPGSGKSTLSKHICKINNNYYHIESDQYKTIPKILKKANEYMIENKSIIIDATNSSIKKRNHSCNLGLL